MLTAGAECGEQNVELCLDQSEGDALRIDARADALVAPEVFSPGCALTFTPLAKGGGDHARVWLVQYQARRRSSRRFRAPEAG